MENNTKIVGNGQGILDQLQSFNSLVGCPLRPAEEPRLRRERRRTERVSWKVRLDGKMSVRQFNRHQKRSTQFSERTNRLPNEAPRTRWEAIMAGSVDTHDQQSQPIPAKKLVKVFLPAKFARERHSRSRRSPVRSAAKAGDDGGGDSESDPGDPPGPKLTVPSLSTSPTLTTPQWNNSTLSRTPHPCHWCMDWRWAA